MLTGSLETCAEKYPDYPIPTLFVPPSLGAFEASVFIDAEIESNGKEYHTNKILTTSYTFLLLKIYKSSVDIATPSRPLYMFDRVSMHLDSLLRPRLQQETGDRAIAQNASKSYLHH